MYSRLTYLIALATCLSFSKAYSQNDTSHYDLGRVRLDKKFTQSITIKGADLQRQPFANISDALNVWFYGIYTNSNYLVYVVDGNIINDVNAYNINDIEEITLVQNAAAQVSGALPQQQILLIKTRRNKPGKSGIEAAGQTNLVSIRNTSDITDLKSPTNVYHQYYLSGYKNTDVINAGISATYLRDVSPISATQQFNIITPLGFDRFKFNGYADVKLGANNTLSATATYVPQITRFNYDNVDLYNTSDPNNQIQTNIAEHAKQNLFNGGIRLNSQLAKGLQNSLSATYNHYNYTEDNNSKIAGAGVGPDNFQQTNSVSKNIDRKNVLLLRDNLSYQKTIGNFSIEPAVDFTYRYTRDSIANVTTSTTYSGTDPLTINQLVNSSTTTNHSYYKRKDYLLTPSLSLAFKNSIDIQGGFVTVLNSKKDLIGANNTDFKRIFPFASTSVNVSSLAGINIVGIKLYGSYSKQNRLLQSDGEHLNDFTNGNASNSPLNAEYYYLINYYPSASYNMLKAFNVYTAGADISLSALVSVNYNFERGGLTIPVLYYLPYGSNGSITTLGYADSKYKRNRIGVNFNVINKASTRFITGLNTTNIKQRSNLGTGDIALGDNVWTGGWVNRLEIERIFTGLDILYKTGEGNYANPYTAYNPSAMGSSFSLQNIYFGYNLKTKQFKNLEVFANGRNIWQNKKSDITDNRRFYGLGFKLGL
ncbi:hypothetical protein MTO98_04075 [Mucilaginibacter sp. SMC90]|uniref:hypothetical protein n=1 Tax=Mucilaginibacter sp. SMC90 TaxID=2929803 RepID=UPI001FB2C2D5|nr:hypothetical protein [Mucilaginibacter sp. SMC90]UOE50248.1 hypothetical protein MTO98_04075 [Mucilaginibacter sp. SMC90]